MNHLIKLLFICSASLAFIGFGCAEKKHREKGEIKLTYTIVPEDFERNLYYVDWEDTLGLSEGYLPDNILGRPKEIWCFITNKKKDTLGYYHGQSMAQTYCGFQSKDSIVVLNFMVGLNMFPNAFDKDTTGLMAYWEAHKTPIALEPIEVNLETDLRKDFEVILKELE